MSLTLALWLAFGPPESSDSLGVLTHAVESVGEDDAPSPAAIEQALAEVSKSPERLAASSDLRLLVRKARFTLVWSHLTAGDRVRATAAMDDLIRKTGPFPIEKGWNFGPDVSNLLDVRIAALDHAGMATIELTCSACQVIVNEREIPSATNNHKATQLPLPLGEYRIFVSFDAGDPQMRMFHLNKRGDNQAWKVSPIPPSGPPTTVAIEEGIASSPPAHEPANPRPDAPLAPLPSAPSTTPNDHAEAIKPSPEPKQKRLLPLAAEISGLVVGAGLLITGGILLGLDGTCPGGGDINNLAECPETYHNKPQGVSLTALGAALLLTGGVLVIVDQVRVGKDSGTQAMLTWTARF
jgi:hypothetical protein